MPDDELHPEDAAAMREPGPPGGGVSGVPGCFATDAVGAPFTRAKRCHLDTTEHFFVMVGQILDSALIGGVLVRLTLSDGGVVEGVPRAPASDVSVGDELDDSVYRRWIMLEATTVDLADVRAAAIVRPVG